MKKILIVLLLTIATILPTVASSWVKIDEWQYIDKDSIKYYVNDYGRIDYQKKIFWKKDTNIDDKYTIEIERIFNKKVGYIINQDIIDFNKKQHACKSIIVYDENSNVITSFTYKDFQLDWRSIVPDSMGEKLYELVKSPKTLKKMYKMQTQY